MPKGRAQARKSVQADLGGDFAAQSARALELAQANVQRLEALVAEKMRQIGDLLENVDQGLFTFNLDLTVNPDHSARACSVLHLDTLEGKSLVEILRLSPAQAEWFLAWIEVVGREHARQRWAKLARLSPVREIVLDGENGTSHIITIEYRKIMDAQGRVKIMALAKDVTEKRALERRLKEEKDRHENKVRNILGVATHAEELIAEFLKDAGRRLDRMLEAMLMGASDWTRQMFFDCHTLKGNAGGFGFDALAQAAQDLETHLKAMETDSGNASLAAIHNALRTMDEERCKIGEAYRLLFGSLEKPPVRMDADKVERLQGLAQKVGKHPAAADVRELVEACRTLRHRGLGSLALKYQELLERAGAKLGKDAEFVVLDPDVELDPALIQQVDEPLSHILRNALAHGIEDPETRAQRGKGRGRIALSYSRDGNLHTFQVEDDGNGIDGEALARKALASGLLSAEEAARLGPMEKANLLFMPGLSTASEADLISGRGQGMAIAWAKIRALGGGLSLETRPSLGTRFTLSFRYPAGEG